MLRGVFTLGLGMALGYGLSVVELNGRPLVQQLGQMWRAPLVQRSLSSLRKQVPAAAARLRQEVPRGLAKLERLQRAHEASEAADAAGASTAGTHPAEAHAAEDRHGLDATLQGAHKRR